MRILLIVGDNEFSIVLKHALRAISDSLDIDCASTFCEAEEMLRHASYKATLCDGDMKPTCKSVRRATERIRKIQPQTKILFMASKDSDPEASRLADRIIMKPFTSSDIVTETSNAISKD